jgi:hypothetical protein
MKAILKAFAVCVVTIAAGCGDDDNGPSYKFKDQNASGEIDNVGWAYEDGFVEIDDDGSGGTQLWIELTLAQSGEICSLVPEGDMVFFFVPNAVGVYKLKFDLSGNSDDSQTATLFDEDDFGNFIATEGAIEIISITATEVIGRIDARCDGESYVNGNFTVSFCPT